MIRPSTERCAAARNALSHYVTARRQQPHFANARSIRNALDRARLRQANRLLDGGVPIDEAALGTIEAADILASRVFFKPWPTRDTTTVK